MFTVKPTERRHFLLRTLRLLSQKNKSRPTGSKVQRTAWTSLWMFYQFWHNPNSSKHDSPLYTKLYDSSDPMMLFPSTLVNIQGPLWASYYGSQLERQTRPAPRSLPPARGEGEKPKRRKETDSRFQLGPAASFFIGLPSNDREEGRAEVPEPADPSSAATWGTAREQVQQVEPLAASHEEPSLPSSLCAQRSSLCMRKGLTHKGSDLSTILQPVWGLWQTLGEHVIEITCASKDSITHSELEI